MSSPHEASVRWTPDSYQYDPAREQLSRIPSRRSGDGSRRRRSCSRSRPRSTSPPPRRPERRAGTDEKAWYKKKTLWASLASAATVAALVPTAMSARGSQRSADASHRSADSVERSTRAAIRSADAAEQSADASSRAAIAALRSARAVEKSTEAALATAMASGYIDVHGNCLPPAAAKKQKPMRDQATFDRQPPKRVLTTAGMGMASGRARAR